MNKVGQYLYKKVHKSKNSPWRTDIWLYLWVIFGEFEWKEFLQFETIRFTFWYWTHTKTGYVIKEFYGPKIKG